MTNKRRLGNHNVPSFKELYEKAYDDMEGMSGLGPLDTEPDKEFVKPQEKARKKFLFKLRQVIKGHFYDDSVKSGYDFVGDLEENGYKGVLRQDEDTDIYEFTREGSPINVRFYYNTLGGLSLNIVMVRDTSRDQTLLWNRTAPPQYTDTVADIRQFMKGSRGGQAMSISENDDN